MSNSWVGNIILTNETEILDTEGVKVFDLLLCDGSSFDDGVYPILSAKLVSAGESGTLTPNMTSPDAYIVYKIVADAS